MYGWRPGEKYVSQRHATVSRLDELQAALLAAKLPHLDEWNATRRRLAAAYRDRLAGEAGLVQLPPADGVFHLFVVRSPERDGLRTYLAEQGIGTDVHYPLPAHLQAPYAASGQGAGSLPNTERLAEEVLSLPLYPELALDDLDYVAEHVQRWATAQRTTGGPASRVR
jgi:dTDP-4-amino-4,6-dideoxygalactose transaminase